MRVQPGCDGGSKSQKKRGELVIHEVRIYDNLKVLRKIIKGTKGKELQINSLALKAGVYFVEIIGTDNYRETKQVIIQP